MFTWLNGWLKDQNFPVVLLILGFLLTIVSFFSISDITKFAITPLSVPLYYVFPVAILMVATSIIIFLMSRDQITPDLNQKPKIIKKSAFLSAPMNAFVVKGQPDEYKNSRKEMLRIIGEMKRNCGIKDVFYAGENIEDVTKFDLPGPSLKDDFLYIHEREYFILIWPDKFASRSSLIELGIALTLNKKCICFIKDYDDLPFLLQGAQNVTRNINIVKYDDIQDLIQKLCNSKERVIDWLFR